MTGPVVVKFGGASLSDPESVLATVAKLRTESHGVVVVASAREGVTDLLRQLLDHPGRVAEHRRILAELDRIHAGTTSTGRWQRARTGDLLRRIRRDRPTDGPLRDRLMAQGERLAVHWLSARLNERGIPSVPIEADHLGLITDNAYGESGILLDRSAAAVRRGLGRVLSRGQVPVVTGFFGRSLEGRVATLGRGGSDYTATALGAILGAPRVELIKRHAAVLTADPRSVPRARPIARMSYDEAEELAQFGARVLHPMAVEPARQYGVEIWVRSLSNPRLVTAIGPSRPGEAIRAMAVLAPLRLLRVRVPGGRQRPGIVAEVTGFLAKAGINVVALFTSSAILSVVVAPEAARAGRRALEPIAAGRAAEIEGPIRVALVTTIGDGILDDVRKLPPKLLARSEGISATRRSVAVAVPETAGRDALAAVHRALVEGARA